MRPDKPLLPGSTLGVFGGGQLGRMFVAAAAPLGYRTVVFAPENDSPAGKLADSHIKADYSDSVALSQFISRCDAVTTEFENVPVAAYETVYDRLPISPYPNALQIAQNRINEKKFLAAAGIALVPYAAVYPDSNLAQALSDITWPAIIKTARFGYDGKGQREVGNMQEVAAAMAEIGAQGYVVEQALDLKAELSVVLVRSAAGECELYPVADNEHRNGILHVSSVPSLLAPEVCNEARHIAVALAEVMNYCGVLAVEFFLSGDDKLMVNEIAPRPHNSGHYTIDACPASQFEQQARMMCGLSAASIRLLTPTVMVNLLGDLWNDGEPDWKVLLTQPDVRLHLYGKGEARCGRKMGHFCVVGKDIARLRQRALQLYRELCR